MMTTVIDRETMKRLLGDPRTRLLDVLPAEQYAKGHLPGAHNVPLKELVEWAACAADKTAPVITYCNDAL